MIVKTTTERPIEMSGMNLGIECPVMYGSESALACRNESCQSMSDSTARHEDENLVEVV